jgi:hypothetical protein
VVVRGAAPKGATGTGSTGAEGLREGAGKRAEARLRDALTDAVVGAQCCRDAFSSEHGVASKLQRNVVASLLALKLAPREEFRTPQGYNVFYYSIELANLERANLARAVGPCPYAMGRYSDIPYVIATSSIRSLIVVTQEGSSYRG